MSRTRISPEKIDQIVELRLAGLSVREVAPKVGVARNTVILHYTRYLRERAHDRIEANEERVAEIESRMELNWRNARNAAAGSLLVDDPNAARFLEVERKALEALSKFTDRVSEPEQAGRVSAAQAESIARVIRDAAVSLPEEHRKEFLAAAVTQLKSM